MMAPSEIAEALQELKDTGRLDAWFVFEYDNFGMGTAAREWFVTLSGSKTALKYTRREVEAFLLGASLL